MVWKYAKIRCKLRGNHHVFKRFSFSSNRLIKGGFSSISLSICILYGFQFWSVITVEVVWQRVSGCDNGFLTFRSWNTQKKTFLIIWLSHLILSVKTTPDFDRVRQKEPAVLLLALLYLEFNFCVEFKCCHLLCSFYATFVLITVLNSPWYSWKSLNLS